MSALAGALLLGQLAGLAPSGYVGTLVLSDRSEVRLRAPFVNGGPLALDLETAPVGAISIASRRSSYSVGYGSRFSYLDIESTRTLAFWHTGRVAAAWSLRKLRFTLTLDGAGGQQSAFGVLPMTPLGDVPTAGTPPPASGPPQQPPGSTPLPGATPPPTPTAQYRPQVFILTTASFAAGAGASYAFDRRWAAAVGGSYNMSGGLDYLSQASLRPNRGGAVTASVSHTLSAHDTVGLRTAGAYVYTFGVPSHTIPLQTYIVNTALTFARSWSPRTAGALAAGVSYFDEHKVTADSNGSLGMSGDASLTHLEPLPGHSDLRLRGAVSLGAAYNAFLAKAQQQLVASAAAVWTRKQVTVTLTGDGAASLPFDEPDASRVVNGTATVGYAPVPAVLVSTGVRTSQQILPTFTLNQPFQWAAFLAVLVRTPDIHF